MIESFKNRKIDHSKNCLIYRNLTRKGNWYSIKQGSLVVAHTTGVFIKDAEFVVVHSGKERAIRTGQRNVHAYIKGKVSTSGPDLTNRITYNPFNKIGFHHKESKKEIKSASFVAINQKGVFV